MIPRIPTRPIRPVLAVALAIAVSAPLLAACGGDSSSTTSGADTGAPTTALADTLLPTTGIPTTAPADGNVFGFVTLDSSPGEPHVLLLVDVADLLNGSEAHQAAVAAGVITEDEELPNDVFVVDSGATVSLPMFDDATITVQAAGADGTLEPLVLGPADLYEAVDGMVGGVALYGVIPGEPLPMTLTVHDGAVVAAVMEYLP